MKIIGIMGNSGSGKTTFSNILADKKSVGVIHVDDFVGEAKKKYFRMFLQPEENNSTESTKENPKLKASAKKFFYSNKLAFSFLTRVRSMLVSNSIEKQIDEFEKEGKQLVVIDDWLLTSHKKLQSKLTHIYILNRRFTERRKSLKLRDGLSTEELRITDLPSALGLLKMPSGKNVSAIKNVGTLEDLKDKAQKVYSRYITPSFDERYKIEETNITLVNMPKIVRLIEQANRTGKSNKDKEIE